MQNWLLLFIVLTAAAIVLQTVVLAATFLRLRRIDNEVGELRQRFNDRVDPLLNRLDDILKTVQVNARSILGDLAALTGLGRTQAEKFDRVTDELSDRACGQIARVDEFLNRAVAAVESTGEKIERNVAAPVREVAALVHGVEAALDYLAERRRTGTNAAAPGPGTAEEELFI